MKTSPRVNVAIVGAGKVGAVLGRILAENGVHISCVVSRSSGSARAAGKFLGCRNVSTDVHAIPAQTDFVYITAPHSAIPEVALQLASHGTLNFKKVSVCHASGMLSAGALRPLQRKGATVFSFHPLQTFPRSFSPADIVPTARGIYFGVDGTPSAVRKARQFAKMLGGKVVMIPPAKRALYHAACVVASNHLTTMLAVVAEIFSTLEIRKVPFFSAFKPILLATLGNIEQTSPSQALSGPVARGGVETVREHLHAVARFTPEISSYYAAVTRETVRLALDKGSITRTQADEMNTMVGQFLRSQSRSRKNR